MLWPKFLLNSKELVAIFRVMCDLRPTANPEQLQLGLQAVMMAKRLGLKDKFPEIFDHMKPVFDKFALEACKICKSTKEEVPVIMLAAEALLNTLETSQTTLDDIIK